MGVISYVLGLLGLVFLTVMVCGLVHSDPGDTVPGEDKRFAGLYAMAFMGACAWLAPHLWPRLLERLGLH